LLNCRGDGRRKIVHLVDGISDTTDGVDHFLCCRLNARDLTTDLVGFRLRLPRQVLDFAGSCCLDGRVEGQKVFLIRDCHDSLEHVADLSGGYSKALDAFLGLGNSVTVCFDILVDCRT
jgi:hypothetical protein